MKTIEEMTTEEICQELDRSGYELDLDIFSREELIEVYISSTELTEEEEGKARKWNLATVKKKCSESDSIDIDTLSDDLLKRVLAKAREEGGTVEAEESPISVPGEKMEEAKRERQGHREIEEVPVATVSKSKSGLTVRFGSQALQKIEYKTQEELDAIQSAGKLVGHDPVKKIAYVK